MWTGGFRADPVSPDCDDTDASVFPGAPETWYDGIDQNCDEAQTTTRMATASTSLPMAARTVTTRTPS